MPLNVPILICWSYLSNILCFLIYFLTSIFVCQWLCGCAWKFPRQGQIWPPGWLPLTAIGKAVLKTSSHTFRAAMTALCGIRLGILTFPPWLSQSCSGNQNISFKPTSQFWGCCCLKVSLKRVHYCNSCCRKRFYTVDANWVKFKNPLKIYQKDLDWNCMEGELCVNV